MEIIKESMNAADFILLNKAEKDKKGLLLFTFHGCYISFYVKLV